MIRELAFVAAFMTACVASANLFAADPLPATLRAAIIVDTSKEPVAPGEFAPTWQSLSNYKVPQWYQDAKFGIWAHWGPQCEPEDGDWYARNMYIQGSAQNKFHIAHYGPVSSFGFKDVIHQWKAENWNPSELMALYKKAGAQYFVALANHHDNFDLWDSRYQPWNSQRVGPHKNLIAGWAQAARAEGMRFGVSIHAARAWAWYDVAQGADKKGPFGGVPYDGNLTLADGKGKWWEGLDPQDLYAQRHKTDDNPTKSKGRINTGGAGDQPSQAYCDKYYNRTIDLINQVHPDLLYFDDTALPLWPISDAGLKIAAHYYNTNAAEHGGTVEGLIFGKILDDFQRKCLVLDIERGESDKIESLPWQTDTCIGNWHYDRALYDKSGYKSAATVIRLLADVVSKNGNLLLSVPVRADGTIDEKERAVVEGIAAWMDVNKEAIFGTRPWKVYGEGNGKLTSAADVRYTAKDGVVYALVLGKPKGDVSLKSLSKSARFLDKPIARVEQLGAGNIKWQQDDDALVIKPDAANIANSQTVVFRVSQ